MNELSRARRDIEAAWRSFVADGQCPRSVKPEIARSWQRVRGEWRVDPSLRECPRLANAEEAMRRAEAEAALRVASPLLAQYADRLANDGHVVAYFDAEGVMLSIAGNRRTRAQLADVNFAPGACWAEHAVGTNGIGTALAEARPVEVFASEHFVEAWQPWTCASVPVRCRGALVGVVDITSPWAAHNPMLLLCAEGLARAIEGQLEAATARQESAWLARAAQRAAGARDEFLTIASHELRTPLTPLQLKLQHLHRMATGTEASVSQRKLAAALRSADGDVRRFVQVIETLIDAARVSGGALRLAVAPTDLAATARRVVERHRDDIATHDCDVVVDGREVVGLWDGARLEQALECLLMNALKYAPGRIEMSVGVSDGAARVAVRDHGPGLSPEDQARIFERFERATSYRHVSGFGLGLYLAREIVEAHRGVIHVESVLGEGSEFVVELPLRGLAHSPVAIADAYLAQP